ncbi:MAG: SMI1/KNR4 family protein [Bacteroidia bacterium]
MNIFKLLTENRDETFIPPAANWKAATELGLKDATWVNFIPLLNGGYFFSRSLHIYGLCTEPSSHSILHINNLIRNLYGDLIRDEVFFACDLFGNQFGFSKEGISFWNIETAESEVVAEDFREWMSVLEVETDYFTAEPLAIEWQDTLRPLEWDERLTPKTPFVIGGEYTPSNLKAGRFDDIARFNAAIAKQIFDLPDGTAIDLETIDIPDTQ